MAKCRHQRRFAINFRGVERHQIPKNRTEECDVDEALSMHDREIQGN